MRDGLGCLFRRGLLFMEAQSTAPCGRFFYVNYCRWHYIYTFNTDNNLRREWYCSYYRWGKWDPNKLSDLPKVSTSKWQTQGSALGLLDPKCHGLPVMPLYLISNWTGTSSVTWPFFSFHPECPCGWPFLPGPIQISKVHLKWPLVHITGFPSQPNTSTQSPSQSIYFLPYYIPNYKL